MRKPTPDNYRGLKIIKSSVRVAGGTMPQLVTRLRCDVGGVMLEGKTWRDLELQIDQQLDQAT